MKTAFTLLATVLFLILVNDNATAQQYKVRQVMSTMGMKSETTIYVKGMRKRTEGGGYTGMPNSLVTIEQCDKQRTITINDKKKLYYIEPFSKETEEVIMEDEKPSPKAKPVATPAKSVSQKGGVVTMWYNITDTGERKKMYGLTARHVWTTQKIKPSADACMKDSMLMKTDGWYIDLPQFNCPVRYTATNTGGVGGTDCKDRYVTRQSGKGKLGFPLIEKRTMMMGDGTAQTGRFEMDLETLEFSTAKLDSMLFEIPVGYALAKNIGELHEMPDMAALQELYGNKNQGSNNKQGNAAEAKGSGGVRIGVLAPTGVEQSQTSVLQAHLVSTLTGSTVHAVPVASAEEAKKNNCDWMLTTQFAQIKGTGKVGGLLKAVRNADPTSVSSYNVDARLILSNLSDGATRSEKAVSGKYEGSAEGAAKRALEEGSRLLLSELK